MLDAERRYGDGGVRCWEIRRHDASARVKCKGGHHIALLATLLVRGIVPSRGDEEDRGWLPAKSCLQLQRTYLPIAG